MMYETNHFTHDAATATFHEDSAGITVDSNDDDIRFDWDSIETVTVDDPPYETAFDTTEFHKLPATVAKPIPQPYHHGDSIVWLKKPREELKKASWSLDNRPWTFGHPDTGMVKDVGDIHGFWKNPRYVEETDDLDADLLIPKGDEQARETIEETGDVSVGFYNQIAPVTDYNGVIGGADDVDEDQLDGYQTKMLFDHVASVETGRCAGEDGCGIDAVHKGNFSAVDSTTSVLSESGTDAAVGDWVQWDSSGGTAYGKIDEVVTDGCTTRGKGDQEVCAEDDDPALVIEVYDNETGESKDEFVRHKMSTVNDWSGPTTDAVDIYIDSDRAIVVDDGTVTLLDASDIDLTPPQAAQDNAQMALDAREDTGNPNDCGEETGWRRANQLADGGELSVDVVSKMSQFERHQQNSEQGEEGRADCGWMMWKAWGGDEGIEWAGRMMSKMEESEDAFKYTTVITEESDDADNTLSMQQTTDQAPEGIHVADDTWFAVGSDEHPDESTEWADDAKFPVDDCGDVQDAWTLRGSGDISIDRSTLESRIQRVADALDCPNQFKPWSDAYDGPTGPEAAADAAKHYSVCGSRKGMTLERDTSSETATDIDDDNTNQSKIMNLEFDDLSTDAAIARLEDNHEGASEKLDDLRAYQDKATAAEDAAEELDLDSPTDLADAVSMLKERRDELESKVEDLSEPMVEEDAEFIAERTDRFGETADEVIETVKEDVDEATELADEMADKRELVEDLSSGFEETVANADSESGSSNSGITDSTGYAKTPWE